MRENLVLDLREAADKWRANHPAVMTFEIRYDLALCEAANAIEELQGRAKVLEKVADKWCEAVPKWIPVTERLPLYGQDVLAVRTYGDGEKCQEVLMAHIAVWNEETGEKWWNATNITHWMPLPEPPKEVDNEHTD